MTQHHHSITIVGEALRFQRGNRGVFGTVKCTTTKNGNEFTRWYDVSDSADDAPCPPDHALVKVVGEDSIRTYTKKDGSEGYGTKVWAFRGITLLEERDQVADALGATVVDDGDVPF